MKLNVPYKKQWGVGANESRNDCGPACLAMILAAYDIHKTVDEVFRATGAAPDALINFDQMIRAGKALGLNLQHKHLSLAAVKQSLENKIPLIALVNYRHFPGKQDKYNGAHFVTVIGKTPTKVIVHDPNRLRGNTYGDSVELTDEQFINMWELNNQEHGNQNSQVLIPDHTMNTTAGVLTRREAIAAAYLGVYGRAPNKSELDRWDASQKDIDICIKELIASLEYKEKIAALEEKIERLKEITSETDEVIGGHLKNIRKQEQQIKDLTDHNRKLKEDLSKADEMLKEAEEERNAAGRREESLESKLKSTETLNEKLIKDLANKEDEMRDAVEEMERRLAEVVTFGEKWKQASGVAWVIEGMNRIFRGGDRG